MADRILPTETQAPASAPTPHAYNDPDLEPIEFLQAVYHATHLPMSIRIDAARALLPFTEPRPASIPSSRIGCTIVIGGLGPYDHGLSAEDPEQINTISQSFSSSASNNPHPQCGAPAPLNTEMNSNPPPFPDYSRPPTPDELQEIKAAINNLRPDLAHLPVPEPHLCPCGHWIFGSYPCCETRCKTRMN
jgi:hypothetical protein